MNAMTNLIEDSKRTLQGTEADLVRNAKALIADMERLVSNIESGYHVNDLGEVQSRGTAIDRLCALRQERVNSLKALEYVNEKMEASK